VKDKAFVGASVVAAIAASMCCIFPIVFVMIGVGVAGAAAFFATWRPLLLGITFALLALGFYFSYREPRQACEPGSECPLRNAKQSGRLWLWIATVLVILFTAFPLYSGTVARFLLSKH
jgi:mercuric ion transport protein